MKKKITMPHYPNIISSKRAKKILNEIKNENRMPYFIKAFPGVRIIHRELIVDPADANKKIWSNFTLEHLQQIASGQ